MTPVLATRYQVKVFAGPGAATPLAAWPGQGVYVVPGGHVTGGKTCGRPVCRETFRIYTLVPGPALAAEMSKPRSPCSGLSLSPARVPPPPRWLYLNAGHASVSGARPISAGESGKTLTFSFTIGNDAYYWDWNACVKDTVSKDGLGLPGSHGCGAPRVLRTASYLG